MHAEERALLCLVAPTHCRYPRLLSSAQLGSRTTLVLAIETDAILETGGIMHAFDYESGQEKWNLPLEYGGNVYGYKGMTPAVEPVNGIVIFLAYGPRVVAIRPCCLCPCRRPPCCLQRQASGMTKRVVC
jgi:hypothetical protein